MSGTVQSSTSTDASAANAKMLQQMQDFKDGKINITKNDLKENIQAMMSEGEEAPAILLDLYQSYSKIDKNNDGISYKEFETYKNSTAGILNSLGFSTGKKFNANLIMSQYASALLNGGNQGSDAASLYGQIAPSLLDVGSNNTGALSTNYNNQIMQKYLSNYSSSASSLLSKTSLLT